MKTVFRKVLFNGQKNSKLSSKKIIKLLSQDYDAVSVFVHKKIDSTNDAAKRLLRSGLNTPAIIVADTQTNGRGRADHRFYSPSKTGIYMSVVVFPKVRLFDSVAITTAAAVAVVRAIKSFAPLDLKIKWVNDIFLNNKKVCGILTECSSSDPDSPGGVIIGVGINLTTSVFPDDIADSAASLNCELIEKNRLVAQTAREIFRACENLKEGSYMEDYRKLSLVTGKKIEYFKNGNKVTAQAIGIDDNGGLIVEHSDKKTSVLTGGEVSVTLTTL